MEIEEFFATFGSGVFIFIVIALFVIINIGKKKAEQNKEREKQEAEQYKQRSAEIASPIIDEQRRRQEELKQRLAQKYAQTQSAKAAEQAAKHAKHVEDSHEHAHLGEEEHYEEIVGSLGEINDEGCEDLSGVRFIATDLAYELQSSNDVDYSRLAQAMVLGDIINTPRFKAPYSRKK